MNFDSDLLSVFQVRFPLHERNGIEWKEFEVSFIEIANMDADADRHFGVERLLKEVLWRSEAEASLSYYDLDLWGCPSALLPDRVNVIWIDSLFFPDRPMETWAIETLAFLVNQVQLCEQSGFAVKLHLIFG